MLEIDFANRQSRHPVEAQRLVAAVRLILERAGIQAGSVSLAIVDDATIHQLNRRYLQHDYPTDVLSFLLNSSPGRVDGEVIVSADTAAEAGMRYGWRLDDEVLLYVIHGILHLVGYDDQTSADSTAMREQERYYLSCFQLTPRYEI